MLLALDTSTPWVSVALHDGEGVVRSARGEQPMRHGEQLAPLVQHVLDGPDPRADPARRGVDGVDAVAVGVGPGAYTGLRVGVVTARTLGLVLGVPVHGVLSLDVLAAEAVADGVAEPFLATIDARRKELFWAAYDAQGRRTSGPDVGRPETLPAGLLTVGAGPEIYPAAFPRSRGPLTPSADRLAELVAGGQATLLDPEPVYLRRPDAVAPGPAKRVR